MGRHDVPHLTAAELASTADIDAYTREAARQISALSLELAARADELKVMLARAAQAEGMGRHEARTAAKRVTGQLGRASFALIMAEGHVNRAWNRYCQVFDELLNPQAAGRSFQWR